MVWLTNTAPEFDREKRRRWYAALMGAIGAAVFIASSLLSVWSSGAGSPFSGQPLWGSLIVLFGFWFFFFLLKYAAAYALWYKPYASRKRAICLSVLAFLIVYFLISGAVTLSSMFADPRRAPKVFFETLWEWHRFTYGIPYLAAVVIGWRFARPVPDARDSF